LKELDQNQTLEIDPLLAGSFLYQKCSKGQAQHEQGQDQSYLGIDIAVKDLKRQDYDYLQKYAGEAGHEDGGQGQIGQPRPACRECKKTEYEK
jgi:hypothetical protein